MKSFIIKAFVLILSLCVFSFAAAKEADLKAPVKKIIKFEHQKEYYDSNSNEYKDVVLVTCAIDAEGLKCWSEGGKYASTTDSQILLIATDILDFFIDHTDDHKFNAFTILWQTQSAVGDVMVAGIGAESGMSKMNEYYSNGPYTKWPKFNLIKQMSAPQTFEYKPVCIIGNDQNNAEVKVCGTGPSTFEVRYMEDFLNDTDAFEANACAVAFDYTDSYGAWYGSQYHSTSTTHGVQSLGEGFSYDPKSPIVIGGYFSQGEGSKETDQYGNTHAPMTCSGVTGISYPGFYYDSSEEFNCGSLNTIRNKLLENDCGKPRKKKYSKLVERINFAENKAELTSKSHLAHIEFERGIYNLNERNHGGYKVVEFTDKSGKNKVSMNLKQTWNNFDNRSFVKAFHAMISSFDKFHVVYNGMYEFEDYRIFDKNWKELKLGKSAGYESARNFKVDGEVFTCIESTCYRVVGGN